VTPVQTTLDVALGERSYPVVITPDLPGPMVAEHIATLSAGRRARVLVVTDSNVGPLYGADVVAAIEAVGCDTRLVTLPAGEAHKTVVTWSSVVDAALDHGIRRKDVIVALGGGVVGDIAGFAAASVNRGVAFVQVPTTLLAQVDSSVGGKTGVNHTTGKNLIGAFWQPRAVIASQRVLETLPARERRCGLAEAIKHGFIADPAMLRSAVDAAADLMALEPAVTSKLVADCVRIKAAVVEADEREAGQRAVLNFGHTFGHAFERELGYGALTHGEAVALGMVMAADLSVAFGVSDDPSLGLFVTEVLDALGLPANPYAPNRPSLDRLIAAARADKKAVDADRVNFILLRDAGSPLIQVHPWAHIREALEPRFESRRPQ